MKFLRYYGKVNLIGNSIKFTERRGITLKLAVPGPTMTIQVVYTGRGIPVEYQHLLFSEFQQATDNILTRDTTHGTGLGLYIAKLLAEGMSGRLYLASTQAGKGTTFILELPAVTPQKAATTPKKL